MKLHQPVQEAGAEWWDTPEVSPFQHMTGSKSAPLLKAYKANVACAESQAGSNWRDRIPRRASPRTYAYGGIGENNTAEASQNFPRLGLPDHKHRHLPSYSAQGVSYCLLQDFSELHFTIGLTCLGQQLLTARPRPCHGVIH